MNDSIGQKKKVFFKSLPFTLIVLFLFLSCVEEVKKKTEGVKPRPKKETVSCNEGGDRDGPEVSITSRLKIIDTHNAGEYELLGRCSQNRQEVQITVNDFSLEEYPVCKSSHWKVFLDLTSLVREKNEKIQFKVKQGDRSNVACKEVKVAFGCPANYVPVPPLKDYYERAFCVMKYEAKIADKNASKAISVPEGKPLSSVSHDIAIRLCRNNGSHYSIIDNEKWQTIARHIEEIDENWSSGRASRTEGNFLNCGVNIGGPYAASSNDENNCSHSSCKQGWSYYTRTHFLPGGYVIWDLCGNVGEMMRDKNTLSYTFRDPVYLLTGDAKNRFGPEKEYKKLESGRGFRQREALHWGLGEARLSRNGSLIIRGAQNSEAGIFSVSLDKDLDSRVPYNVGFRCVYIP